MDDDVEENVTIRFVMPENKDEFSVSGNIFFFINLPLASYVIVRYYLFPL